MRMATGMIALPALHRPEWFKFTVGPLFGEDERDQLKLPDEPTIRKEEESMWTKFTTQLKYVKLHGSFGWLSQTGSDAMIIGYGKYGAISKEPLLKWYLSLFERVLNSGERKLLVTGYSFRDEHINKIIVKAIRDSGLKLFIMSPRAPIDFRGELLSAPKPRFYTTELWNSLSGYFPGTVDDFYQVGHSFVPTRARAFLNALGVYNG
jgi:hypothetical protein